VMIIDAGPFRDVFSGRKIPGCEGVDKRLLASILFTAAFV